MITQTANCLRINLTEREIIPCPTTVQNGQNQINKRNAFLFSLIFAEYIADLR